MIPAEEILHYTFPAGVTREWIGIGQSWLGPMLVPLIIVKGPEPGLRMVAVAAQHGDEAFAVLGLHRLAEELDPSRIRGEAWLLPCLNIHGYVHGSRHSPFDGQDMDRVHPGNLQGTMTEQIAGALSTYILPGANLLLDLHGGSPENGDIAFAKWMDAEGSTVAREVAEQIQVEFLVESSNKHTSGTIEEMSRRLGVPAIAIEACNAYGTAKDNAAEMANYVTRALQALGMLPGNLDPWPAPPVRHTATHRAATGGAFDCYVSYGQQVAEGETIGVVRNLLGERVQTVVASVSGTVSVMRSGIRVHPGETLCTLSFDAEA